MGFKRIKQAFLLASAFLSAGAENIEMTELNAQSINPPGELIVYQSPNIHRESEHTSCKVH